MIVRAICIPEKVGDLQVGWSFMYPMIFEGERVFEVEVNDMIAFFVDNIMGYCYHHTWIKIINPLWGTIIRSHSIDQKDMIGKKYIFVQRTVRGYQSYYMNIGDKTYYWHSDAIQFDNDHITIDIGGEELILI